MLKKFFKWLGYVPIEDLHDLVIDNNTKLSRFRSEYQAVTEQLNFYRNYKPDQQVSIIEDRRAGNSTRLADAYIQILFKNKQVKVADHHPTIEATNFLFRIVIRRLDIEHASVIPYLLVDRSRFTITLKEEKQWGGFRQTSKPHGGTK